MESLPHHIVPLTGYTVAGCILKVLADAWPPVSLIPDGLVHCLHTKMPKCMGCLDQLISLLHLWNALPSLLCLQHQRSLHVLLGIAATMLSLHSKPLPHMFHYLCSM